MSQPKQNFFDQRTLLAIVLTTVVWLGWQMHLQKKYPQNAKPDQTETAETLPAPVEGGQKAATITPGATQTKNDEISEAQTAPEQLVAVDSKTWSFKISSRGMGIKNFELKTYEDRQGVPIKIGADIDGFLPLSTQLTGTKRVLDFKIEAVSPTHFVGRAAASGLEITKTMILDESSYRIDTDVQVAGQAESFLGLSTFLTETLFITPPKTSFFANEKQKGVYLSSEVQEIYALGSDKSERVHVDDKNEAKVQLDKVKVAALGSQYFTQAFVDHSDVASELKAEVNPLNRSIVASLNHPVLNRAQGLKLKYTAFVGPKDLQILRHVDESLIGVVDFGFFALIGRPILKALKWFHSVTSNWGVAIILLTILIRFLVLPFNIVSFKSMKSMQMIQPMIQDLKTRYKNDQTRLNQEMLQLFKTYKVNPVGGCLPVLLQIPVFFALYQVLGHSVELYKAPFLFWIQDLSHKDPFYVTPILMGITMFFQMKITPTSADPMQAKILMFMPLIMTVFMLTLPSGLTLYILVSTLFGIAQQLYLMKSYQHLTPVTAKK